MAFRSSRPAAPRRALALLVALGAAGAVAACDAPTPTATPSAPPVLLATGADGFQPLECPVGTTSTSSGVVGALGGTVTLGGHSIVVPAGAVLGLTELTLVEPASNYMEIAVHANGEEHFTFLAPIAITISYDRCTRSNIDKETLTVWHIDETTGEFLEHMGGTDDKEARNVTFSTDHLSGYVIAN